MQGSATTLAQCQQEAAPAANGWLHAQGGWPGWQLAAARIACSVNRPGNTQAAPPHRQLSQLPRILVQGKGPQARGHRQHAQDGLQGAGGRATSEAAVG